MRLATVAYGGEQLPAVIGEADTVRLVRDLIDPAPASMIDLIAAGPELLAHLANAQAVPVDGAELLAPIPRPSRCVFCVGWNYLEHFEEGRGKRGGNYDPPVIPEYPTLFS